MSRFARSETRLGRSRDTSDATPRCLVSSIAIHVPSCWSRMFSLAELDISAGKKEGLSTRSSSIGLGGRRAGGSVVGAWERKGSGRIVNDTEPNSTSRLAIACRLMPMAHRNGSIALGRWIRAETTKYWTVGSGRQRSSKDLWRELPGERTL